MATHSSVLAWRIPWTEEPGGLQAIGLWRLWYNWSNLACTHKVARVDFLPLRGEKKQYLAGLLGPISCHSNIQMYWVERCPSMPPIPSPPSLSPCYSSFLPPAFLLLLFPSSSSFSPPPPLPLLILFPPSPLPSSPFFLLFLKDRSWTKKEDGGGQASVGALYCPTSPCNWLNHGSGGFQVRRENKLEALWSMRIHWLKSIKPEMVQPLWASHTHSRSCWGNGNQGTWHMQLKRFCVESESLPEGREGIVCHCFRFSPGEPALFSSWLTHPTPLPHALPQEQPRQDLLSARKRPAFFGLQFPSD